MAKIQAKRDTGKAKVFLISILPAAILFVSVWLWAAFYYGPVLRIARESSFWSSDDTLMYFMENRPWGGLWEYGRMLLQLYRWPMLGALLTAFMLTLSTHLLGYCLRLKGWWRALQYIPVTLYLGITAFVGFDLFFEAETGIFMGVPALCTLVLAVLSGIIWSFKRKRADKTPAATPVYISLPAILPVLIAIGITQFLRPDVRVVTRMQCKLLELEQAEDHEYAEKWFEMQEIARNNPRLSTRPIAAYYAIATVMRGEQGSNMFDIRMEYDDPWMHGITDTCQSHFFHQESDSLNSTCLNYYQMECDYHAGLMQTAIHHAMEHLTMNGPSLRSLKMLTKCALLTGEHEVAKKYLRILEEVPFEGDFIHKYRTMLNNPELIEADPEFQMVRLTEPVRNNFEQIFTPPVFLGYNAALMEGRSQNALMNSLTVQLYTKTMPGFIERLQPLAGKTLPKTYAEAVVLRSAKQPELLQAFPGLDIYRQELSNFAQRVTPLMKDENGKDMRQENAPELFKENKGYYPYYYYFGNLRATRKKNDTKNSSGSGVN